MRAIKLAASLPEHLTKDQQTMPPSFANVRIFVRITPMIPINFLRFLLQFGDLQKRIRFDDCEREMKVLDKRHHPQHGFRLRDDRINAALNLSRSDEDYLASVVSCNQPYFAALQGDRGIMIDLHEAKGVSST